MKKIKITFFGSDKYSQIVFKGLKAEKKFQLVGLEEKPEIGVLASYGKILPAEILAVPDKGILNLHPSLLPKYRGPSPVQTAILNGEKQTGLTIIKMDQQIDHGPIVVQFAEKILANDTAESLYFRLFSAGVETLITILPSFIEGKIEPKEQDHSQATYTQKFTRDHGKIDWQKPVDYLERQIRAFYPWPGTWTEVKITRSSQVLTRKLKILEAHLGNKKLVFDKVQLEGKKPVSFKQFSEGYPTFTFPKD